MAKDVTIRVTGTNPDGTINVQMPDGGNPSWEARADRRDRPL